MSPVRPWIVVVALLVILVSVVAVVNERSQTQLRWRAGFLPGNPQRGGELLYDRGCMACHAVAGVGGRSAPDLSRPARTPSDLAEVAAVMWNHAPEMWQQMASLDYWPPELTPRDAADLMAFLFVAGYLEERGQPQRGQAVLARKGCRKCHATGEAEQKIGPDLTQWSASVNPILWAQRLWNHAPEMEEAMADQGMEWPQLSSQEVVDVLAFLRGVGTGPRRIPPLPGDPWLGRALLRQRCQNCHRAEGEGGDIGPDLSESSGTRSLSGFAASLWNHAPAMGERMKELGVDRPTFTEQEMADLVTYLFAIRYFQTPGNPGAGKEVYLRNCSFCHGEAGQGGSGPNLRALGARASATFMASTLWNHGPWMYREMLSQGREWPRFEGAEMRDLIEYLRSLS